MLLPITHNNFWHCLVQFFWTTFPETAVSSSQNSHSYITLHIFLIVCHPNERQWHDGRCCSVSLVKMQASFSKNPVFIFGELQTAVEWGFCESSKLSHLVNFTCTVTFSYGSKSYLSAAILDRVNLQRCWSENICRSSCVILVIINKLKVNHWTPEIFAKNACSGHFGVFLAGFRPN